MKKYLIVSAAALVALASTAMAQSYTFSNDLHLGSTGPDVVALQTWLIQNGYDIPYISMGLQAKGYYGFQTMAAVIKLQQTAGLPAYGFFGPLTRNWVNTHNGGDNRGASLQVTSPNGGETWQTGTQQVIRWTTSPGPSNQTADIKLEYPTPSCALPGQPVRCMILTRAPILIAAGVNLNTGSYAWNVGSLSTLCGNGNVGYAACPVVPLPLQDGQYKIQICPTNGSACDDSDNNFTVTSNPQTSNGAPVINGVDAPTTLNVNQTGTWTVRASDPNNSPLSYTVDWGDSSVCQPGYMCPGAAQPQAAYVQQTTFTHSYSAAGTFTVKFTVKNNLGYTAQTSSTVQVGNQSSAGPLKITSPNGGEVWQKGTTQTITWTSPYYFRATYADLKIIRKQDPLQCPAGYMCMPNAPDVHTIAQNIGINQNSYSWNVGSFIDSLAPNSYPAVSSSIVAGQYTIQICESGTTNCDSSDSYFTISDSASNQAQVRVTSPNGGENWIANSVRTISWTLTNNTDPYAKVDLYLGKNIIPPCIAIYPQPASCAGMFQPSYTLDKNIAANTTYNWIVATDIANNPIPAGSYVVQVCMAGSLTNCDTSDNQFNITPSSSCPPGYYCSVAPNSNY